MALPQYTGMTVTHVLKATHLKVQTSDHETFRCNPRQKFP